VQITINATDNASTVVDTATKRINRSWIQMRNQQRAVQREFELNNRTLVQTGRILTTVGSIVQRVISVYNTWQLLQIRTALTAKNLRDAQRDLQDVFLEFGGTSREFQEAQQRVIDQQEEMQRVAKETNFVYALMVVGILTQLGRLTKIIPQLKKFTATVKGLRGGATGSTTQTTLSTGATKPSAISKITGKVPSVGGGKVPAIGGALAGGGISALAFLAGLAGEQQAFAPQTDELGNIIPPDVTPPETGFDQIAQIGKDISVVINNFINSPTPQGMVDEIQERTRNALTFGNQNRGG
jgi:hypothetical protein